MRTPRARKEGGAGGGWSEGCTIDFRIIAVILLDKLLVRLKERGHRVLVFSQMTIVLDILQGPLFSFFL